MKIKSQKQLRRQLAASLFFAISAVSLSGQCASISYNHTIHFDQGKDYSPWIPGINSDIFQKPEGLGTCAYGGCPTLSIDFTYDTDTRTISNVSSSSDIVSSTYRNYVNFHAYPDDYTKNYFGIDGIAGSYFDDRRYNPGAFWTAYLINNNSLELLSLASLSFANFESVGHLSTGLTSPDHYYATSQTLTNKSSVSNVPLPPALIMFASSCLGLGLVGSKRKRRPMQVTV